LALAILVGVFGITPRLAARTELDHEQTLNTQRIVIYALARLDTPKIELPLPGTINAFQQASIYARTNGYVKRWLVDIGDRIRQGDLMAELDTPEVDQQLRQAKANVDEARASLAIAQTAADRWNVMVQDHAVSQEEADEKNATRNEAQATLNADLANVAQLTDLENFKEIRAPFTGTITYRNIEVGNLVSVGTASSTAGTEIYRIAQTDPLRVYVNVPEASTGFIHPGVIASLHVPAYPDRLFTGIVVRSAGSIDDTSRTMQTEIQVDNKDGALLPGTFAEVRLNLVDSTPAILIPANTLIVNAAGTQVALLETTDDPDTFKVHLQPVKVGRDFGTEVEILQDLNDGDRLVANPPADLSEGMTVTGKMPPKAPAPPAPNNTPQKT
jgi:RND family efflux transporter MFP subunit